jgi:4-hydroxybenzoate polyprenyltransferase
MMRGRVRSGSREPLLRALGAWARERFPPQNAVFVLLVTALGVWFGRALAHPGPVAIKASDLLAFLGLWAYFLLLRVLDEHKDYELDLHNHPGRVLQSGRITLKNLKVVAGAAIIVQLAVSILIDHGIGAVTELWCVLMVWTVLMLKEFFIEWPRRWFVLYAFMHMLSMPLAFLWLAQIGALTELPPSTRWLVVLGGLIAATLEVARKFRAPADERPTIDTYTQALGVGGASATLAGLVLLAAAAAAGLLNAAVTVSPLVYAFGLVAAIIPTIVATALFSRDPRADRAELVETLTGIGTVLLLAVLIASLLIGRGVA